MHSYLNVTLLFVHLNSPLSKETSLTIIHLAAK